MKTSEMVKEEIRTINPEITDELLDLLCEYIKLKNLSAPKKNTQQGVIL